MNAHHCCQTAVTSVGDFTATSLLRRGGELAGWIVPGVILALLPKCPACVAAWIAIATGAGVSLAAAAYLRVGVIIVCIGLFAYLGIRRAVRHLTPTKPSSSGRVPCSIC